MSSIQTLKIHKELHEWHVRHLVKQIKKIQEHCTHQHQQETSKVEFDCDYGFYYKVNTKKCLDCGYDI